MVWRRETGQTLVEFAFVLPIILVFVLLMVDFGFVIDRREVAQHAVREGARYAAVESDLGAITSHMSDESGGMLSNIQVCYVDGSDDNSNPGNAGDSVQVSGEYTYEFIVGSGTLFSGGIPKIRMTPSSQARLEKSVPGANQC
jgi:Flp pilus assembly protein TadG